MDLALAIACIITDTAVDTPPCNLESIHLAAIQFEVLDTRESKYLLASPSDFTDDLKIIRERYEELRNAPTVADADRFPDRVRVGDWMTQNRSYASWLGEYKTICRDDWINDAIIESDMIYKTLDLVRDARCEYYYIYVRRRALAALRDAIGPQCYYAGVIPYVVPVHYFRRID